MFIQGQVKFNYMSYITKSNPYRIHCDYQRIIPKLAYRPILSWSLFGGPGFVLATRQLPIERIIIDLPLNTKEAVELALSNIDEGKICVRCGNPSRCTERQYRDWSKI
jgi:hypothetical protein